MKFLNYILVTCLILGIFSCEEVIELDLNSVTPQVVIEGFVTDEIGPYTIQIKKTVDFYDSNTFPAQEDAQVKISDDRGNEEFLIETSPGIYQTSTLQGERGVTYNLEVELEGVNYTAKSRMPENLIVLDTLTSEFLEESIFYKEGYYVTAYFSDPPDIDNYYRLQVLVNGEVYIFTFENEDGEVEQSERDINFWLTNDKFTDGNLQDFEFPHTLKAGDTLEITLQQLDRATFDYYNNLVDVIYGDGIAPSNPISNINNGALGYFGAFSVAKRTIVIQE
ncbi:DUF4249 domain-containing protein [Cellulophaga sp. E16_2]|uniref:DUF4249 domain-containing protein n=1 Tax=Cellulophaga sp. E16_2 TaxID=2789297 RepID=UPI001A931588|nr:DUF4249 domain-containing protein [Cellulophaga sp. E16_2]MBO0593509.1 DUF4249 domain-containing protein [Cellulophaga sp. E16_2]